MHNYNASAMHRGIRSFIWLVSIIALSAVALSILDRWEEKRIVEEESVIRDTASVFLVVYGGEETDELGDLSEYAKVGCEDILVPYEIPVVSKRLKSVLTALSGFEPPRGLNNPFHEKELSVVDVQKRGHASAIVDLAGEPKLGGMCDTPRLKGQIESTVSLYEENFTIRLNGSEEDYECMGDVRGGCG